MNFDDFAKRRAAHGLAALVAIGLPVVAVALPVAFTEEEVADDLLGAFDVWPADIDGDGFRDIAAVSTVANDVVWFRNPGLDGGGGPWESFDIDLTFTGAITVTVGDVDLDGDADIMAGANGAGDIVWWENQGNPLDGRTNWTARTIERSYAGVTSVFLVDMDLDNDLDLVCCSENTNDIRWYQNPMPDSAATASWRETEVGDAFGGAHEVWVDDVTGDGLPDILGAAIIDGDISMWPHPGVANVLRERSWVEVEINGNIFQGATAVVGGDMDGDGNMDLIGTSAIDGQVAWWKNPGGAAALDGDWDEFLILRAFGGAKNLDVSDFDNDGDLDIAAVAQANGDIIWLDNPGGVASRSEANWSVAILDTVFNQAVGVAAGDLDNDGDEEIIAASAELHDVVVWRNPTLTPVVGEPMAPEIVSIKRLSENGGVVTYEIEFVSGEGNDYTVSGSGDLKTYTAETTVVGTAGTTKVQVTGNGGERFWRVGLTE